MMVSLVPLSLAGNTVANVDPNGPEFICAGSRRARPARMPSAAYVLEGLPT